jgi:hypothetical protein
MINRLSALDPLLAKLGTADYDRGAEFRPLPRSIAAIREQLELGRYRTDANHDYIERLGFSMEVVTPPMSQERIRVFIRCSNYAPGIPNSAKIEFCDSSPKASPELLRRAMEEMITAWAAERGLVMTIGMEDLVPFVQGWMFVGSMMVLPVPPSALPALPTGVRVESRGDQSSLIVLTDERFDLDNAAHVALARGTHAALSGAGFLELWKKP